MRVLVVDDEPSMRQYLDVLFSRNGYEVSLASGVGTAREALSSGGIDLVV